MLYVGLCSGPENDSVLETLRDEVRFDLFFSKNWHVKIDSTHNEKQ